MEILTYTTIIALIYYLTFLFAANRFVLHKFNKNPVSNTELISLSALMLVSVNVNIICCLLMTHDPLMNYMTYILGDSPSFFNYLSSGVIIFLGNIVVLTISYILSKVFCDFLSKSSTVFLRPLIWITINFLLIKLISIYYEAYLGTQSFTIL